MPDFAANPTSPHQQSKSRHWVLRYLWGALFLLLTLLAAWIGFAGEKMSETEWGFVAFNSTAVEVQQQWEHGWPFVYLNRDYTGVGSNPVALWQGDKDFHAAMFIADVLIFLAIIALLAWFCCGRRAGQTQRGLSISLKTSLVAIAAICAIAAQLGNVHHRSQREVEYGRKWEALGHDVHYEYIGPRWFSRLGLKNATPLSLVAVTGISTRRKAGYTMGYKEPFLYRELVELPQLWHLDLSGVEISDEELHRLLALRADWPLRHLAVAGGDFNGSSLAGYQTLPYLRSFEATKSVFNDEGFAQLKHFPALKQIEVRDAKVTSLSVQTAMELPHLKTIHFYHTEVTEQDCDQLREQGVDCKATAPANSRWRYEIDWMGR